MKQFLDALKAAVGTAHVLTDGDLAAYEQDWRSVRAARRWLLCGPDRLRR